MVAQQPEAPCGWSVVWVYMLPGDFYLLLNFFSFVNVFFYFFFLKGKYHRGSCFKLKSKRKFSQKTLFQLQRHVKVLLACEAKWLKTSEGDGSRAAEEKEAPMEASSCFHGLS